MKKLVIIRKMFEMLYPELKVIVRYNKHRHFEIILKNVNSSYVDPDTFRVMLKIPGKDSFVMEDFVKGLYGYCPILNENNCLIKYVDKIGGRPITRPMI